MARCVLVYIDDILIYSGTLEGHLKLIQEVMRRLKLAGLLLKRIKCEFCLSAVDFVDLSCQMKALNLSRVRSTSLKRFPCLRRRPK